MPAAALGLSAGQRDDLSTEGGWSLASLVPGLLPRRFGDGKTRTIVSDVLSLAALGLGGVLISPETPSSDCDHAPRRVAAARLQSGRTLALGTLALGLLRGESGGLIPLAAATLGTGLRRLQKKAGG